MHKGKQKSEAKQGNNLAEDKGVPRQRQPRQLDLSQLYVSG